MTFMAIENTLESTSNITNPVELLNERTVHELNTIGYSPIISSENENSEDISDLNSIQMDKYYSKTQDERIAQLKESSKRDKLFNRFLRIYITEYKVKSKQKRQFKCWFFVCITFLIIIVPIGCAGLIVYLINHSENELSSIITSVTLILESAASFLVLPKIIAKYLFDKQEDERLTNIISSMQEYNLKSKDRMKDQNNNED